MVVFFKYRIGGWTFNVCPYERGNRKGIHFPYKNTYVCDLFAETAGTLEGDIFVESSIH